MTENRLLKYSEYFILFIPLISVYIPTLVYPVTNEIGREVPFRPPGYVFAIVWPILLILLGISWFKRRKLGWILNLIYILLTILLSIWFIIYDNSKIAGLIDIILCLLITIGLFLFEIKKKSRYLQNFTLIPLILWLSFASILNIYAIKYEIN